MERVDISLGLTKQNGANLTQNVLFASGEYCGGKKPFMKCHRPL